MDNSDRFIEIGSVEKLRYAIKVKQVNDELLEQLSSSLQWIIHYCEKHQIPLPENDKIISLIDRAIDIERKLPSDQPIGNTKKNNSQGNRTLNNKRFIIGT